MVAGLTLPAPAAVGDEWGNALNVAIHSVNADVEAIKARTITAGLGLTGGGDLSANRAFTVDFAASGASSATKAVRADDSRLSDARTPLAHNHDASYAPLAHGHTIANVTSLQATLDAKALATRAITTGGTSGLTGGGDLSADRSLAVNFATAAPLGLAMAAVVGTSTKAAKEDHVHPAPAWQAYTPTIVSGSAGTGGSAALTGRYVQIGKTIHYEIRLVFGTSGFSFSQNTVVGTPMTRTNPNIYGSNVMVKFFDNPAGNVYLGGGLQWSSGVSGYTLGTNGLFTPGLPFTLSTGDVVEFAGTYEAS